MRLVNSWFLEGKKRDDSEDEDDNEVVYDDSNSDDAAEPASGDEVCLPATVVSLSFVNHYWSTLGKKKHHPGHAEEKARCRCRPQPSTQEEREGCR